VSDAKSAWNKAHDARRDDERERALASLHEHIDRLEKELRKANEDCQTLAAENKQLAASVIRLQEHLDRLDRAQPKRGSH